MLHILYLYGSKIHCQIIIPRHREHFFNHYILKVLILLAILFCGHTSRCKFLVIFVNLIAEIIFITGQNRFGTGI